MSATALMARVPQERRARVQEGLEMVGENADAWLCGSCGNFGLMGGVSANF